MKWKNRLKEIDRLICQYGYGNPNKLPDYHLDRAPAPCGDRVPENGRLREKMMAPPGVIVGTPHKQGPMVMSASELSWAGGKKS